jgi:hypothetical protein
MQSPYAHVAPSHRVETGREKAHRLLGRGRKLPHKLDICAIEARIARERLSLESHLAICRGAHGQRPTVHRISRRRHAARSRRRYTTELLRMSQGCQSWRGGYAAGYKTQKDLRPTASGKAQPREAPLVVEVVQLQQSQPAPLAV